MEVDPRGSDQRVLILTPIGKDAALAQSVLERAGVECWSCPNLDAVCDQLDLGAAAVLVTEESIAADRQARLREWLAHQPPWSDLPVLVLARPGADSAAVATAMDLLGNVTVLERPTRVAALVSAARTAVRARRRQYQIRDQLAERERAVEAQSLLAAIVASSDDAIISKTLEGRIISWNAGAVRLFGYSPAEAIGQPVTMLIPADRQDEETAIISRLRLGHRIEHFETVRVAKDGRRIDISLTVSPVRDASGRIIGASKVARDIGDSKRAEQALLEADRRKDEFLAMLAHELRNPLAPIRNSLHILRLSTRDLPNAHRVGEMMERQVHHMVRLVDDLMEVSRITRGKIELRKEYVEVAPVIRGAVETSRPFIDAGGHQLVLSLPEEPVAVDGDPVRLTQVIANLLNNAAKYTDASGTIWLSVRREDNEAVISVRDSGTGIPPDMLPQVFGLFTQGERSPGRAQGGLGIGLTLVKTLVEMHGGTVAAHSEGLGRGSEFVVRLPVATAAPPAAADASAKKPSSALDSRRILVVDDNHDAAESLGVLLEMLGAQVRVAFSGPDALETLTSYDPTVVLLDIGMPGMDGHEVARRIRAQPRFRDVTLIALTGWGQEEDYRRSRTVGFDHHLIKPADVAALQTLLDSL